MKFLMFLCHDVPDAHDDSLVNLLAGSLLRAHAEITREFPRNKAGCLLFGQFIHWMYTLPKNYCKLKGFSYLAVREQKE